MLCFKLSCNDYQNYVQVALFDQPQPHPSFLLEATAKLPMRAYFRLQGSVHPRRRPDKIINNIIINKRIYNIVCISGERINKIKNKVE